MLLLQLHCALAVMKRRCYAWCCLQKVHETLLSVCSTVDSLSTAAVVFTASVTYADSKSVLLDRCWEVQLGY